MVVGICNVCNREKKIFNKQQNLCEQCYKDQRWEIRKLTLEKIKCQCRPECKEMIYPITKGGIKRKYAIGHHQIGERNPRYNGYKTTDDDYVLIRAKDHPNKRKHTGYVSEHRLIMEKYLGRYLTKEEVVHHIDGNPKNNDISNLKLYPNNAAHIMDTLRLDTSGRKCFLCGSENTTRKWKIDRYYYYWMETFLGFCCNKCYLLFRRRGLWPKIKARR
jgi:hypothetical protein